MKRVMCGAAVLAVAVAACGDPNTDDRRGYTKAPLEKPTVLIGGEQPGAMTRYGGPNRVVAEEIRLPEEAETPAGPAAPRPAVALPAGVTEEMVTEGEALFAGGGNCAACHGRGATGGPLAPALNDGSWIHVDGSFDAIVGIITSGVPTPQQFPAPMPARGGAAITDEQVRQLAAYIYAISRGD